MEEYPVKVHIYDISKGLARSMSMPLLGKQIDGIWHTGILVYGQEFYFGGMGIESCEPCGTILGQPDSIIDLGVTQVPFDMFMEYLSEQSNTSFRPECYHLLEHNCNTFSNEIANFLTGNNIPAYVTNLPQEVLNTPFGAMIRPLIDSMTVRPAGSSQVFSPTNHNLSQASSSVQKASSAGKPDSKPNKMPSPQNSQPEQAITFPSVKYDDKQAVQRFDQGKRSLASCCSGEEMKLLEEAAEYASLPQKDCTWSIGPDHLHTLVKVVGDASAGDEERCRVAGLLQQVMLKADMVGLLQYDRQHSLITMLHSLINTQCNPALLTLITKMMVNGSSEDDSVAWVMDEATWNHNKETLSNMSVTMSLCLSCLLSDNRDVRSAAAALAANFTKHKLKEENGIELGSALIECLRKTEDKNTQERCLAALHQCVKVSPEVAALIRVMAVDLDAYQNISQISKSIILSIRQSSQSLLI